LLGLAGAAKKGSDTMRASITVSTALSLLCITSSALAQEPPSPVATASAESPRRPHRMLIGSSLGGGSYGADGTPVLGLDMSYAYRLASGRDFGATATLATSQAFAGAFADVIVIPLTRNVSWRVGAEAGVHRVSNRYRSIGGLLTPSEDYHIISAPHGVFLPYGGGKMSIDRTGASGVTWGFQFQVRQDLAHQRHRVLVDSYDEEMHDVGGRTFTLGFYLGHGF
jgi:hypothetical protein